MALVAKLFCPFRGHPSFVAIASRMDLSTQFV